MVCHPPVPSSPLGYLLGLLGARSTPSYWSRRVGQPNMECCYSFDVSETFTFNWPRSAVALSSSCIGDGYWEAYTTSSCVLYEPGWSRIQGIFFSSWLWDGFRSLHNRWQLISLSNTDVHRLDASLFWKVSLYLRDIIKEEDQYIPVTLLEYLKHLHLVEWDTFVKDTKILAGRRTCLMVRTHSVAGFNRELYTRVHTTYSYMGFSSCGYSLPNCFCYDEPRKGH